MPFFVPAVRQESSPTHETRPPTKSASFRDSVLPLRGRIFCCIFARGTAGSFTTKAPRHQGTKAPEAPRHQGTKAPRHQGTKDRRRMRGVQKRIRIAVSNPLIPFAVLGALVTGGDPLLRPRRRHKRMRRRARHFSLTSFCLYWRAKGGGGGPARADDGK